MPIVVEIYLLVLGTLVAGELVARLWRWRKRVRGSAPGNARQHHTPELERRRRLDAAAGRWPGPARWG
jgi:hypothetical protein